MRNTICIFLLVIIFGISGWLGGYSENKKKNLDLNLEQYINPEILPQLSKSILMTGQIINEFIDQIYVYESFATYEKVLKNPEYVKGTYVYSFNGFDGYRSRVINTTNIAREHDIPYIYPFINGKQIYMYSNENWKNHIPGQYRNGMSLIPIIDEDFAFNGKVNKSSAGQKLKIFFDEKIKDNKALFQLAKLRRNVRIDNHEEIKNKYDYKVLYEVNLNNDNMQLENTCFSLKLPNEPGIYRCALYDAQFESEIASMNYYMFIQIIEE